MAVRLHCPRLPAALLPALLCIPAKTPRIIDISHPKWTDIERFDSGPELGFEIGGMGRCHACSEADPATLAHMERTGELALPDPWGAMEHEPEVAAGSSGAGDLDSDSDNEYPSTEAIALNITNGALKDLRAGAGAAGHMGPAASSSAKSAAAINAGRQAMGDIPSASPSPEFDTSAHKGKARRGHPEETYGSRFGAASHDADDDEEREEPPYYSDEGSDSFTPPLHSHRHPHPPLDNEETDHEEGGARNHHHSSSHYSRPDLNHGLPPSKFQSDDDEEGGGAEGAAKQNAGREYRDADGDDDAEIEIPQSERARLAIPGGFRLTKKGLARFEERREMAGREAMRRQREGSDDGEE